MALLRSNLVFSIKTPVLAPTFTVESFSRQGSSLKETKNRIKSVKSIQKITKTMKMIASARLKGAQNRIEESRPFGSSTSSTLNKINSLKVEGGDSKNLLVILSTDRGLCGSINSQLVKFTRNFLADSKNGKCSIAVLGEKVTAQVSRSNPQDLILSVHELSKGGNNFNGVSLITDKLLAQEGGQDYDNIYVLYNKFNSVISFTPTLAHVPSAKTMSKKAEEGLPELDDYEFEDDSKGEHLADLSQFHLTATVFSALLENQASELGARMTSMDTATTNAGEMIKSLTIKYNRGRQAAITTELNEIISGSEALKDSGSSSDFSELVIPLESVRQAISFLNKK